ncbi:MAG: ABC transporter ATP-binding protein [Clostridia bacterium]
MISVNNIYKSFKKLQVLNGVSFTVLDGEIYALVGGNGTGKTTLLNIISGIEKADVGDIRVENKDTRAIHAIPNVIGYVQDVSSAFEYMTAEEYLQYLSSCARLEKDVAKQRVDQLVEMFSMQPYMKRRISTYSKGMKQRLAIAAVLLGNPKVILLDEPTSALDTEAKENLKAIFEKLKKSGKSVIISTNSLWDVENFCDRLGFLSKGRLKFEKTVQELSNRRQKCYVIIAQQGQLAAIYNYFLNKNGYSCELNEFKIVLTPPPEFTMKDVINELNDNAFSILAINEYTPTFKDVFLKEARKND